MGTRCAQTSSACCRGSSLNSVCGGTDYVGDAFRLGKHWHMAAVELVGGCIHALGKEALQIRMNGAVKSPAKSSMPSGSNQMRPSLTSMWEKTAVLGKLDCCVCEDSSASGASAAMYTSPATRSSVPAPVMTLPP